MTLSTGPVMIVEDIAPIRELLEMQLKLRGYRVVTAGDGEEALNIIAQQRPAVIVADILMPRVDGFMLIHKLRSNPQTASDLSCALLLARAGLLGCLANVAINLPHVKDAACAADLSARARMLQAWTQALPQDDSETCPLSPADARGVGQ